MRVGASAESPTYKPENSMAISHPVVPTSATSCLNLFPRSPAKRPKVSLQAMSLTKSYIKRRAEKVKAAQGLWNTRNPEKVHMQYLDG